LWVVFSGFWLMLGYVFAGIVLFIFIITIPFAIQSFKLAGYALWPFGRVVVKAPDASGAVSAIGNVLWVVFAGFWLMLMHVFAGVVLCCTIIGIPFGIANFKMALLALWPFGRQVVSLSQLATDRTLVAVLQVNQLGQPA
jgi:uncharacterized membrane protein YccF (DUF307 family)